MSLAQMELRELVEDLLEISNCIEEAMETQSVHAPPEVRARGKAQRPIFLKCESLLSEELHRRLGGRGELAEVAIDAMEEYVADRQRLAAIFGPLESQESIEKREAEEREALGCTIAEIEEADAKVTEYLEAQYPGVLEEHPIQPCEMLPRPYELGTSGQRPEEENPILWAMKEAAWASLQRLGSNTLVEYLKMWIVKHHDYGPENHAVWGCQGAIIRATDKLMRLKGQYFDGRKMKNKENDWLDLIGYGLIGLVIERGQWPVTTLEATIEDMRGTNSDAYERLEVYRHEHD